MVDLHSLGTQYYFEGSIRPIHLTAEPLIRQMIADVGENPVLATADMGRAKWVQKMSGRLGLDSAYIMKQRLSGEQTEVVALNANVSGRRVVIYDDMIRSVERQRLVQKPSLYQYPCQRLPVCGGRFCEGL